MKKTELVLSFCLLPCVLAAGCGRGADLEASGDLPQIFNLVPVETARIGEGARDFSGITRDEETGQWLVLDDSCRILTLERDGGRWSYRRSLKLNGFQDCEDLALVQRPGGNRRLYFVEEGKGRLTGLPWNSEGFFSGQPPRSFLIDRRFGWLRRNSGLEALCPGPRSPEETILFAAKEEYPRKLYRISLREDAEPDVEVLWDMETVLPPKGDIAALYVYMGDLYVLNQRQDRIHQLRLRDGKLMRTYLLPVSGSRKYEGLFIHKSPEGRTEWVVASEPDVIEVFVISPVR